MLASMLAPSTLVLLAMPPAHSQAPQPAAERREAAAPLFASHEPLTFTIEAPLGAIFKERGKERKEHPGKLILPGVDGQSATLNVQVRTRGKTRAERRICEFPPLRLDFDSKGTGTVFEGQNDLKLVTHCQSGRAEYEQYVLQEYLVYRTYNLLTDVSFTPRLARITYVDTDAKRDTITRYGFLIEPVDVVAARNGVQALRIPAVAPHLADPSSVTLVEVFQYLVGNPDWSAFSLEPGEEACCHNTVPVGAESGPIYSVPYDFDIAGIVNTRYADRLFGTPERKMGIRTVRQRVYRGLCWSEQHLADAFALFNQKREAIYALYRAQPELHPEILEETLEYLDAFYDTINDPQKVKREFTSKCRS
jgi:hypothetical protein